MSRKSEKTIAQTVSAQLKFAVVGVITNKLISQKKWSSAPRPFDTFANGGHSG